MVQHKELAAGRMAELSFVEAMAHVGSEVERAMKWRAKGNKAYAALAVNRALELLDLTLDCTRGFPRLKEAARVREALIDYFYGKNEYQSDDLSWSKYFMPFTYAARFPNL
jgi:hypothetical protein